MAQHQKTSSLVKIQLHPYTSAWRSDFEKLSQELISCIGFLNTQIEHIGSTSVEGLSAKPIIDILVGVRDEAALESVAAPLMANGYVYYEKYNELMPYRRFFVKHSVSREALCLPAIFRTDEEIPASTFEHSHRLAHVHVLPHDSPHWIRHVAFRDYLRVHPEVRNEYQQLKQALSTKDWADGNAYNQAKDAFLKLHEQKAVAWYAGEK